MITDEQVIKALDAYYGIEHVVGARFNLINTMRKALEAYEKSKWVKFDAEDESTYPPIDQIVMCKPFNEPTLQMSLIHDSHPQFDGFFFEDERGFYTDVKNIAYWQPLPEFKE